MAIKINMSTKRQKRETKQVRIGIEWHKRLKILAIDKAIVMSKLLDEVFEKYFDGFVSIEARQILKTERKILSKHLKKRKSRDIGKRNLSAHLIVDNFAQEPKNDTRLTNELDPPRPTQITSESPRPP